MFTICWFYCTSFLSAVYYASAPLVFVVAALVLQRGRVRQRQDLRKAAFALALPACLKLALFDLPDAGLPLWAAVLLLAPLGAGLRWLYCRYAAANVSALRQSPAQARLRLWANIAVAAVAGMGLWVAAPWLGYLTVGHVPRIFMTLPWEMPALACFALILRGFWKLESCAFGDAEFLAREKRYVTRIWTPRDTLWTALVAYVFILALSYVSHDILT